MIVILDTTKGRAHNFKTRKDAGEFIGCSLPTLRGWLKKPFYLHRSLIITHTSNEKVQQSKRALLKKKVAQFRKEEIKHLEKCEAEVAEATGEFQKVISKIQRIRDKGGDVPVNGSRSEQPDIVGGGEQSDNLT